MFTLTVLSLAQASVGSVPGGLGYVAEMYDAASLSDDLSRRQVPDAWLAASLERLRRRFRGRLRVRWVNPYSLGGLYLSVRYRIRSFPAIMIGDEVLGSFGGPAEFEALVVARLSAAGSDVPEETGGRR